MSQQLQEATRLYDDEAQDSERQEELNEEDEDNANVNTKDILILKDSGLTDEQRRHIRHSQRELYKELNEREDLTVEDGRQRNNRLFHNVRFTREAVLDGENLVVLAHKAVKQVDRLIQVRR